VFALLLRLNSRFPLGSGRSGWMRMDILGLRGQPLSFALAEAPPPSASWLKQSCKCVAKVWHPPPSQLAPWAWSSRLKVSGFSSSLSCSACARTNISSAGGTEQAELMLLLLLPVSRLLGLPVGCNYARLNGRPDSSAGQRYKPHRTRRTTD